MRIKMLFSLAIFVLSANTLIANPIRSSIAAMEIDFIPKEEQPPIPLPEGLYAIQYIESDGACFINTGRKISKNALDFGFDCIWSSSTTRGTIINCKQKSEYSCLQISFVEGSYKWVNCSWHGGNFTGTVNSYNRPIRVFVSQSGAYDIDNGAKTGQATPQSAFGYASPIVLFATSYTSITPAAAGARIHYFRIWREDDFEMEMYPVRFLNEFDEWEGGMYDMVSGELFLNQGTGSFVIGPDL